MADEYTLGILEGLVKMKLDAQSKENLNVLKNAKKTTDPMMKEMGALTRQIPGLGKIIQTFKMGGGAAGIAAGGIALFAGLSMFMKDTSKTGQSLKETFATIRSAADDMLMAGVLPRIMDTHVKPLLGDLKAISEMSRKDAGAATNLLRGIKDVGLLGDIISTEANVKAVRGAMGMDQSPIGRKVDDATEAIVDAVKNAAESTGGFVRESPAVSGFGSAKEDLKSGRWGLVVEYLFNTKRYAERERGEAMSSEDTIRRAVSNGVVDGASRVASGQTTNSYVDRIFRVGSPGMNTTGGTTYNTG